MNEIIPVFRKLDKSLNEEDFKFKKWYVWPMIRTQVFEEITNEVNASKGYSKNTYIKKKNIFIFFNRLKELFVRFPSIFNLFKKIDILIISNEGKSEIIDNKKTNKLLWTLDKSLPKTSKALVLNTQLTNIKDSDIPSIDLSIILSIVSRVYAFVHRKKDFSLAQGILERKIYNFFNLKINFKFLYSNYFCRQIILAYIVRLILKIKKPKLIIFSDNGSMGAVNKLAKIEKIKTIDYQHAITTNFHVIYDHAESINQSYKDYLTETLFLWGHYKEEKYKKLYDCKIAGNAFFDHEESLVQSVKEDKKSILIVSDDQLTRNYLESLAKQLATRLPHFSIFYKLRPEEFKSWKSRYSKELQEIPNIKFIDNNDKGLYFYLKTCKYVVGTCSSVLIEALPFSNVIVYEKGWYSIMDDYVDEELVLSAKKEKDVLNLITSDKNAKNTLDRNFLYEQNSLLRIGKLIEELC